MSDDEMQSSAVRPLDEHRQTMMTDQEVARAVSAHVKRGDLSGAESLVLARKNVRPENSVLARIASEICSGG